MSWKTYGRIRVVASLLGLIAALVVLFMLGGRTNTQPPGPVVTPTTYSTPVWPAP